MNRLLTISDALADDLRAHGGDLTLSPRRDDWTEFRVSLPATAAAPSSGA